MAIGKALTRVLDGCATLPVVANAVGLGSTGAGLALAGVAWPVLAVGAAGVLASAGYTYWRDSKNAERNEEIPDIAATLRNVAARMATSQRQQGSQHFALADVLEEAMKDPAARRLIPDHEGVDPLATMLKLIHAKGEERDKLLEENTAVVKGLTTFIAQEFDGIRDAFGLVQEHLDEITDQLRSISTEIDITQWLIERQQAPPLHFPTLENNEANRFKYAAQRVALYGREHELAELDGFLGSNGGFRWSAWTGLAGCGKSRLALRVCRDAIGRGWNAGFFDWDAASARPPQWDFWSPDRPTLIVFDYVYEHAGAIRETLAVLARYQATLVHPIRCLLLERPPPDEAAASWWATILPAGHGTQQAVIADACHDRDERGRPRMRPLGGLSGAATKQILKAIGDELAGADGGGPDAGELERQLGELERVDADRRPLITAFAAEALAEGKLQPQWNATDLVEYMLEKEQARWRTTLENNGVAAADTEKWINLLLLGTLCGGLTLPDDTREFFDHERLRDWIPSRGDYGNGGTLAHLAAGAGSRVIPKLEPDMLGECFVLESMSKRDASDDDLVEFAWEADPVGIADFLIRAANSFPQHESLDRLLAVPTGEGADDEQRISSLMLAAMVCADQTVGLPGVKRPDVPMRVHDLAVRMCDLDGVSSDLLRLRSVALFNAFNRNQPGSDGAVLLLSDLRSLHMSHADDIEVRENLAQALYNAFYDCDPGSEAAISLLSELRALQTSYTDDHAVRECVARALFEAFDRERYGSFNANSFLAQLRVLQASYVDDSTVREWLAKALFNAFNRCDSNNAGAALLLDELRSLHSSHTDDFAVREPLAMALFVAAARAVTGAELDAACALFEEWPPLADVLLAHEVVGPEMRVVLTHAVDLAMNADNEAAFRRIQAVRVAMFDDA